MSAATVSEAADHPLLAAVDAAETAVEHLIKLVDDGAHTDLGAFGLVEVLRHVERVRNKLPVVEGALIEFGSEQGVPGVLSERSMVGVLASGLRLSAGEASRRVRAAEHLATRHSQLGEPLSPIRGHLAQAQRDGRVTPEQVALIDGALRKVGHCDPADVEAGEVLVTDQATQLGFKDLETMVSRVVEAIDPDGILPADEPEHEHRRFLHLKQRTDGSWAGDFRFTPAVGAKLAALLVGEADIAFCVRGAKGQPLDLYRTKRIASTAQTLALITRDGGCSFPACQVSPQFCERHHVISWWDGGDTNIANLTLLCSYHHRHFAQRGWQCVITTDGLPVWIPPRWIDPQRRPILNHRILISTWDVQDPLTFHPPDPPPAGSA